MALLSDADFRAQVEATCARGLELAEVLAGEGMLAGSEIVLGLRQTVRVLFTRLHPPAPVPPPAEPAKELAS